MKRKEPPFVMSKGRIEALTDGVYAIAMTLLALNPEAMNREKAKTLLIVIFSILALIVSFVSPGWSTALYFLLPVLIVLSTFRPRHKEAGQGENV